MHRSKRREIKYSWSCNAALLRMSDVVVLDIIDDEDRAESKPAPAADPATARALRSPTIACGLAASHWCEPREMRRRAER